MTNFARIVNNVAVDVSADPTNSFHPDLAKQFVAVPDTVQPGWRKNGSTWAAPDVTPAPDPAPAVLERLTPMTFYLAFTPAERIAIKTSADPIVVEFWTTFDLAVRLDKPVDPNLASVAGGLEYLVAKSIITADRVEPIKRGIPQ